MHELALTRSLIDLVEKESEKQGFKRALEIRLKLGEYSGVIPDYILDLFPYAAKDTAAEGAELVFEKVPARFACPDCGGTALKMTQGREFFVDSLKVE